MGQTFDGDSLSGWTKAGTVDANATVGGVPGCIKIAGGSYIYRQAPGGQRGYEAQIYINAGTALCDFFFFCDSGGNGLLFRFEARAYSYSGQGNVVGWTTYSNLINNSSITLAPGVWYTIRFVFDLGASTALISIKSADGLQNYTIDATYSSSSIKGDYFGISGDAPVASGLAVKYAAFVDGLRVRGNVVVDGAPAVRKIAILDRTMSKLLASAVSDAGGEYSVEYYGAQDPVFGIAYNDYGRAWKPNTAFALNEPAIPLLAVNGHCYEATTGGMTGATEPAWPIDGGTVADGSVVWSDVGLIERPWVEGPFIPTKPE